MRIPTTIVAFVTVWLPSAGSQAFTSSDVTFWTGSGTNETVLVVDWQGTNAPHALAWGYRWDGTATMRDLLERVALSDARLVTRPHPGYPDSVLYALGYDADGDGGRFVTGFPLPGMENGYALDPEDRYREGWTSGYWSLWRGAGNPYDGGSWSYTGSGYSLIPLTHGSWIGWGYDDDFSSNMTGGADDAPRLPSPAASPYATGVDSYVEGTGVWKDPLLVPDSYYTHAAAALGRPTVDTTGDATAIQESNRVAVIPAYPAFRSFELVSVGLDGELVLSFDHPVEDDPANPFGRDVVVFGNEFQPLGNQAQWADGDPDDFIFANTLASHEPGVVSVSQDGSTWFTFTTGPQADTFAPTLGRRYDPTRPDPALGPSNAWWGLPTDPRWPLDPAVTTNDLAGCTVADVCRAYGPSAGGAAFDISSLPLPVDPDTGHKWFRYLRVQPAEPWVVPEVDAVADVAPAKGYEGWQLEHFTFWDRTDQGIAGEAADPDGDDCDNLLEYVTGRNPWGQDETSLLEMGTVVESNVTYATVSYVRRAELIDTVTEVELTTNFETWTGSGVLQEQRVTPTTGNLVRVEAWLPAHASAAARLRAYRP